MKHNTSSSLDVQLTRRQDDSIKLDIFRKHSWVGRYTHFRSFVPLSYKRNLISTLMFRARKICTTDTIDDEIKKIENVLYENGYPEKFVKVAMMRPEREIGLQTVQKKRIYMTLPFKGDKFAELMASKLRKLIAKTFFAATLCLKFTTRCIIPMQVKDKLPSLATSMFIYKFNCSCGDSYIGRTT